MDVDNIQTIQNFDWEQLKIWQKDCFDALNLVNESTSNDLYAKNIDNLVLELLLAVSKEFKLSMKAALCAWDMYQRCVHYILNSRFLMRLKERPIVTNPFLFLK